MRNGNPWGIERPQLDLVEIARWNHANQRARAAYRSEPTVMPCDGCGTPWKWHRFCPKCREALGSAA